MIANQILTTTLSLADAWGEPRKVRVAWVPERVQDFNLSAEAMGDYAYAWATEDDCPAGLRPTSFGGVELFSRIDQFTGDSQVICEANRVASLDELEPDCYVILRDTGGVEGPEWTEDADADDEYAVADAQRALDARVDAAARKRAEEAASRAADRIVRRNVEFAQLIIERGQGDDPMVCYDRGVAYWNARQPEVVTAVAWYSDDETGWVAANAELAAADTEWLQEVAEQLQ